MRDWIYSRCMLVIPFTYRPEIVDSGGIVILLAYQPRTTLFLGYMEKILLAYGSGLILGVWVMISFTYGLRILDSRDIVKLMAYQPGTYYSWMYGQDEKRGKGRKKYAFG